MPKTNCCEKFHEEHPNLTCCCACHKNSGEKVEINDVVKKIPKGEIISTTEGTSAPQPSAKDWKCECDCHNEKRDDGFMFCAQCSVNHFYGFEEIMNEWIKQGRSEEAIWGVKNFLSGVGGVKIRAMIDGSKPQPDKGWEERFDKLFYRNENRVWMSRGGESYDSVVPEMGKGELFRFISQLLKEAEARGRNSFKKEYEERGGDKKLKEIIHETCVQSRLQAYEEIEKFVEKMTPASESDYTVEYRVAKSQILSFINSKKRNEEN